MKIAIAPKTCAGKWAVALFIVFILLTIGTGMISSTQENEIEYPNPINSPLLGTALYLRFSAAIAASVAGLIAVGKNNERSILVYMAIPLGIVFLIEILILLIGVIIGPPNQY